MAIPDENDENDEIKELQTDQPASEMEIIPPQKDSFINSTINQQQHGGVRIGDSAQISGIVVGGSVTGNINIYMAASKADSLKQSVVVATDAGPRPSCPYPGMESFRPEDARFFYGREKQIQEIVVRLHQQDFLVIIGPSNSGKSSLVFAGLLPQLAVNPYWEPGFWHVVTMRPGAEPMSSLAAALGGNPAQLDATVRTLLATHAPARRLLLVVDQFEEIFTQVHQGETGSDTPQTRRERQTEFIKALKQLSVLSTCAVVITVRADFYPDLMDSELWPLGGERLEITSLQGEELRAAIVKPAATVGVRIEEGLVERLVADAADQPGTLPLLQETLLLLWGRLNGHTLTLASYEQLGRDGRSGLAVALVFKANDAMSRLNPDQQAIARRTFLRLIQFGEGRPDTRRQQALSALRSMEDDPNLFNRTLALLTAHRLLTMSGQEEGEVKVDLAHEALIRDWPTLSEWVAARRDAERTRRRLEDKAKEWKEWVDQGQVENGLLDEGELDEAKKWLTNPHASDLGHRSELLAALMHASQAAITEAEQAKLKQIQERERAILLARINRTLRGLAIVLVAALVMAVLLGIVA
jgi:hypothetical protein